MWYLADPSWPSPNLVLLNNALAQFGWNGGKIVESNWRGALRGRLAGVSWDEAIRDVGPFIERAGEAELLTADNLGRLLLG